MPSSSPSHTSVASDITRVDETHRDTTILVIDDHVLLSNTLVDVLNMMGRTAVAASGVEIADIEAAADEHQPAVALIDFHLGDTMTSESAIRTLTGRDIPVIVITGDGSWQVEARALDAGAVAVIGKGIPTDEVIETIDRALDGQRLVDMNDKLDVIRQLHAERRRRERQLAVFEQLTGREVEVLDMICEGLSAAEIAEASFVSLATVRSQIRSILLKLGLSSQLAAVAEAYRVGWVDRPRQHSSKVAMTATG